MVPSGSSALVESGSSTVGPKQVSQAAPVTPTSPVTLGSVPPVGPTSEPSIAPEPVSMLPVASPPGPVLPRSMPPIEPNLEPPVTPSSLPSSRPMIPPVEPSPVHPVMPESAPQVTSDPEPRTEPHLPVPRADSVVLRGNADSVPSIESGSIPPPSSEPNPAAWFSPGLVAGPGLEADPPALDRGSTSIPIHSSESSDVLAEPIRALPGVDRIDLDSERVVSRSSRDTVELCVPEQGGSFGGERKDSRQLTEDLHGNVVQSGGEDIVEGGMDEADSVVVNGEDRVEAAGMGLFNEKSAVNIEEPHEDVKGAVHHDVSAHQELLAERPQVTSTSVHGDSAPGNKEDGRGEKQGLHQEPFRDANADIGGEVMVEPTVHSGDLGARALVSDSGVGLPQDMVLGPTSPSSGLASALPHAETNPRISEDPVAEQFVEEVAQNAHEAEEAGVAQARKPSNKQALLEETSQDKTPEQAGALQGVSLIGVGQGRANPSGREVQEDRAVGERTEFDDSPSAAIKSSATVESFEARDAMDQEVPESASPDGNVAPAAQELAAGTSLGDDSPTTEPLASENSLESRASSQASAAGNPLARSVPVSPTPVPEPAPTTGPLPSTTLLPSVPTKDET
ncbi:hypothetical protein FRC11_001666, partial [Ceratobasidium sp. 423]